MHIDDEITDVLIGGYMSKDAAQQDYDAATNCGARLWGIAIISLDHSPGLQGRAPTRLS
jgi:hypothetical protein